MKRITKIILTVLFAGMFIASCSDDSDQDPGPNPPPPPPPSSNVTIASVGPSDLFWGDEMTITGTGFSAVKEENIVKFTNVDPGIVAGKCNMNYTSAQGDIEIRSATTTQLKVKVPLKFNILDEPSCGPRKVDLEITVGDKVGKFAGLEFGPLPYVGNFAYHYGWFDVPNVTRIGDSVMLSGGLLATAPNSSKYWDKLRLTIDGMAIPIKYRTVGLDNGWSFFLPVKEFAEINCSEEPDGWGAREMEFKFHIEGTEKSASRMLFVKYFPSQSASCDLCPSPLSKGAGGNPEWKIIGSNMYFTEVRFSPLAPCSGPPQGMDISGSPWTNEIRFSIPLSILEADCGYMVHLANECQSTFIANIAISP